MLLCQTHYYHNQCHYVLQQAMCCSCYHALCCVPEPCSAAFTFKCFPDAVDFDSLGVELAASSVGLLSKQMMSQHCLKKLPTIACMAEVFV